MANSQWYPIMNADNIISVVRGSALTESDVILSFGFKTQALAKAWVAENGVREATIRRARAWAWKALELYRSKHKALPHAMPKGLVTLAAEHAKSVGLDPSLAAAAAQEKWSDEVDEIQEAILYMKSLE